MIEKNKYTTSQFKDIHKNERCFIIGNGPSLTAEDLDLISNEKSFAMNRIGLIYDKTEWRPDYFVCPTGNSVRLDWSKDIIKTVETGIPCWFWNTQQNKQMYAAYPNIIYSTLRGHHESANPLKDPPIEWFSYEPDKWLSKYGTSLITAAQLAFYMGFKEIYLLGCDLGFGLNNHHFDSNYNLGGHMARNRLDDTMTSAHVLIRKASLEAGVNVVNSTRGGYLEVHPRLSLEEVIK